MPTPKSQFTETLQTAFYLAQSYLANLETAPVAATTDLQTLRQRLARPLNNESLPLSQVISELAADWLTSTWDQNAAASCVSASATGAPLLPTLTAP
jgi:hypothetical protein